MNQNTREPVLILKPGREKSVLQRHPWIFSGAIDRLEGTADPGDTAAVYSSKGEFLARAAFSPVSNIRARIWTWDENEQVDKAFLTRRISAAINKRSGLTGSNALRLVHAESDGLPGLVVDRYGEILVLQALSAGVELWKAEITESLIKLTGCSTVYERSDVDVRRLEGLPETSGLLAGPDLPAIVEIHEHGLKYMVDIRGGHKTGFYLDQRDNRLRLREFAAGREVLNCFAYTGGFTLNALAGGATRVLSIDTSLEALEQGERHAELNGFHGRTGGMAAGGCVPGAAPVPRPGTQL